MIRKSALLAHLRSVFRAIFVISARFTNKSSDGNQPELATMVVCTTMNRPSTWTIWPSLRFQLSLWQCYKFVYAMRSHALASWSHRPMSVVLPSENISVSTSHNLWVTQVSQNVRTVRKLPICLIKSDEVVWCCSFYIVAPTVSFHTLSWRHLTRLESCEPLDKRCRQFPVEELHWNSNCSHSNRTASG